MKKVIITGNPVDGFSYFGPYEDHNAAITAATEDERIDYDDWWIADINDPAETCPFKIGDLVQVTHRNVEFNIRERWSGKVMFTASIAADEDTPIDVKVGLAVKWALDAKKPLAGASFIGANLAGTDFAGTNLAGTNLDWANLDGANFTGANLTGANLARASLARANFTGANLDGANLTGTNLTGASLTGASLIGANLDEANLTGANVRGELVTRVIARLNREIDPYSFVAFELQAGGVKVLAGCRWFTVAEYRAHVAANYPETDKATETARILDYIEARAADLGIADINDQAE